MHNYGYLVADFLTVTIVGQLMACFEISLIWLEPRYSHGVRSPISAIVHRLYMAAVGGQYTKFFMFVLTINYHGSLIQPVLKFERPRAGISLKPGH